VTLVPVGVELVKPMELDSVMTKAVTMAMAWSQPPNNALRVPRVVVPVILTEEVCVTVEIVIVRLHLATSIDMIAPQHLLLTSYAKSVVYIVMIVQPKEKTYVTLANVGKAGLWIPPLCAKLVILTVPLDVRNLVFVMPHQRNVTPTINWWQTPRAETRLANHVVPTAHRVSPMESVTVTQVPVTPILATNPPLKSAKLAPVTVWSASLHLMTSKPAVNVKWDLKPKELTPVTFVLTTVLRVRMWVLQSNASLLAVRLDTHIWTPQGHAINAHRTVSHVQQTVMGQRDAHHVPQSTSVGPQMENATIALPTASNAQMMGQPPNVSTTCVILAPHSRTWMAHVQIVLPTATSATSTRTERHSAVSATTNLL
jgi:hypothetical protein